MFIMHAIIESKFCYDAELYNAQSKINVLSRKKVHYTNNIARN